MNTWKWHRVLARVVLVLIIFLAGAGVYFKAKGVVMIPKATWDSILAVANTPPDTIRTSDTIWPDPVIVYVPKPAPVPEPVNDSTYYYRDSLTNDKFAVYVWDSITTRGIIRNRMWSYRLFVPIQITTTNTITKFVPVPIEIPGEKYRWYIDAGLGFGDPGAVYSIGAGWVKGRYSYGLEYQNKSLLAKGRINF
jgi:hypothetical protein